MRLAPSKLEHWEFLLKRWFEVKGRNGAKLRDDKEERLSMKFSLVPLLLGSRDISAEARQALVENRLQEAARLLMQEHGLGCIEASHLLDVSACDED